ncbi:hypothetical protein, partial [Listeria sp. ILCC796]|uniref:hypothetical protein n=1 Tax=Listeria sp. ILCC796 TaxID=1918332 RepID=UPI0013565758
QGQHLQYSMRLYEAIEAEKVLEKYIAFEQSHTTFFAPFSELVRAVQRAVEALQNQVQFNAETGLYSVAKTFAPAMKSLQKSLNEARGIDPKLDAQLEEYLLFKVAYKDSSGKEQAMWILEKDGVRVPNSELEAYLKRTADYQDKDKYTILTLEELNEKIMKAWQDKTYYMDGKVYSGAAGSILQASAYVEDWEGQLAESGIMSALSGVGLGAAIARGSKTYKGGSGAKFGSTEKLTEHFIKHGSEFKGAYKNVDEYLKGANDVVKKGIKVKYAYKGETRTGYVKFMGNNSKGEAKFEFVGTNLSGEITTYHIQSGKKFWKTINGENIPEITPSK